MHHTYYHPSLQRFKAPKPYVSINAFGVANVYNVSFFKPKYNLAPNGSVATKDIKINNFQQAANDTLSMSYTGSLRSLDLSNSFMTAISQGNNAACSLMPLLHQIQNQLDFPLDFNRFLECIPTVIPKDLPDLAKNAYQNIIKEFFNDPDLSDPFWKDPDDGQFWYLKGLNLTFGGSCIPVSERLPVEKCDSGYVIAGKVEDNKCDNKCSTKGIRIEVFDTGKYPDSLEDYKDILEKYGPQSIYINGDNMVRMWLVAQSGSNLSWSDVAHLDTNELKEMLGENFYNTVSNLTHLITLVRSSGPDANGEYSFTFYNSWSDGVPNEFTIKWKSEEDFKIPDLDEPTQQYIRMRSRLQLKVIPCEISSRPIMTSPEQQEECKEKSCTQLGYDRASSDPESECPCECDTIINNRGITIKKLYSKSRSTDSNTGQITVTWEYKCSCEDYSPEELAGGSFDPEQEYVDGCDIKCKNPKSKLPCSGYETGDISPKLQSTFNISSVRSLKLF